MQILNSVSDIVRIKEPSAEDLYDDYEAVIKYVEKLRDDILDLEAKHKREDFVEFNEVKSRLTSFMEEVFSKGRSFKENYQTKAVSGLDSFADYNTALMAAESYIESTQERYEKALAAEAIRIEKLKAEQRIVDGLKQTAWALVDVAAIGLAIMSGGTLAPISVAILTFSAAEITEGAGNIYLGITGDGSSIAFNPIRDTLFMGNQDVYNVASLAVNIADMKLSKPKVSSLDDIARFGAKSVEAKGINRVKDLTKKLLGKVDDVGDVKKGGKGVSAVDEAVEAVGKGSKAVGKDKIHAEISKLKFDDIINTPKGNRPNPSSYLSKEYIDRHLSQFNDGASIIMTKEQYINYVKGSSTIGIPFDGTQFVLPKSYCDDIANMAKGEVSYYEKALGFDKGHFADGGGLIRLDIKDLDGLNLRMPSGNEAGANSHWIPGGKTDGGIPEAVTDLIPNDPSNITVSEIK